MNFYTLFSMTPPPNSGNGGSLVSTLIMFATIGAIIYFLIRVSRKKKQPKIKRVKRNINNKDIFDR